MNELKKGVDLSCFTVLDLLDVIKRNKCEIALDTLKYNRIGKKTELDKRLTEDEKKELIDAIEKAENQEEVTAAVDKVASAKREINFRWNSEKQKIAELTWHESRANVSMLFRIDGVAEIGENSFGLDKEFKTHIWRNYTIIRDGQLNIDVLPVVLTKEAHQILCDNGLESLVGEEFREGIVIEINLQDIPLLDSNIFKELSYKDYFKKLYKLFSLKAAKKVYTACKNEVFPPSRVETLSEIYGEDAAQWLLGIGITDQGFTPKKKEIPGANTYKVKELIAKMKGISSVPSYNAFTKKLNENKKLNAPDMLMKAPYDENIKAKTLYTMNGVLDSDMYGRFLLQALLDIEEKLKKVSLELAKLRFTILVDKAEFKEFEHSENYKLSIELIDGQETECSMEIKETEIEI